MHNGWMSAVISDAGESDADLYCRVKVGCVQSAEKNWWEGGIKKKKETKLQI